MKTFYTSPGSPEPLGATWDGRGTNFALYSEGATGVVLCVLDSDGQEHRLPIRRRTEFVWHVYVEGLPPGTRYGYRVEGPWDPERGLRFNSANLLIDPYARALERTEDWAKGAFSYDTSAPDKDLVRSTVDSRAAPFGLIVDPAFDWADDAPPNIPLRRTIIYEAHVKGLTARHPDVPPDLRGTYAGLASEPVLRHLRELGITAIELLPIHGFVDDEFLQNRGLHNYWGYNTIAFFAPDVRYRSGPEPGSEVAEFKRMVKALHAAGIEVILDVVYNHTAEGNHLGPTFSLKGIDNATYYRLVPGAARYYFDYTGTGNTVNVTHPQSLRLIMDSLRYWVEDMHVDGFRFDLASTLARGLYDVDKLSSFFTVIHQDPVINRVKLIAEPWDLGAGGYQVGRFPVRWSEWNGRYRDTMRAFWRGDGGRAADLGYRLTGSSDLYQQGQRNPSASINFVTAHDGFTLRDLVTYEVKHNEANGDENRDGADDNLSFNCGAEGETEDPSIRSMRQRQVRNILSTLLLSQGVPMLSAGDEMWRTQRGNNNAYCQDNELSWVDWNLTEEAASLLEFTRRAIRMRRAHPLLERATFFGGREIRGVGVRDVVWFRHDGASMTDDDWSNVGTSSLAVFMAGSGVEATDEAGDPQLDDDLVLIFNASASDLDFVVPAFVERGRALSWTAFLDTTVDVPNEQIDPGARTRVAGRSMKAFCRRALGPGGLQAAYGAASSTYRLQLPGLGFSGARALASYLNDLGVGALYTSPYLRAEHGSTHGYNVVDHAAIHPELGTRDDYDALTNTLRELSMGHIIDFVPNHVGIGSGENAWFADVLENGQSSTFADFFDIDWHPPAALLKDKVLLPVLGRQFGQEVTDRNIAVRREDGRLVVAYYDKTFPTSLASYLIVLERALDSSRAHAGNAHRLELESIIGALRHLPSSNTTDALAKASRARETNVIRRRLARLCSESEEMRLAIDDAVAAVSQNPDTLSAFLGAQNFRLSYWKVATEEINYRRFFDVNELAAVRMEEPRVFAAAHSLLLDLVRDGRVTGVRLDHTDGLYDPEGYLRSLQASVREALREGHRPADAPIYVVAEKILQPGEELPRSWSLSGTTGYDYLAVANGLWVDPSAEPALTRLYVSFTGDAQEYAGIVHQAKRDVMDDTFSSEIHVLAQRLKRIAEASRDAMDFTLPGLTRAIKETVAALSVYRTYLRPGLNAPPEDERHIADAVEIAKEQNPRVEPSLFDFLRDVLMLRVGGAEGMRFTMKFQQITSPVMAKGVEDTAQYRFSRLVCLNDVGCDPARFGAEIREFHQFNSSLLGRWPLSMTTTSTHDTKRTEDVRTRLAVLSEIPDIWGDFVQRVDERRRVAKSGAGVRARDAYLFYQTVVGAWPFTGLDIDATPAFVERIVSYMQKAAREAKLDTSWKSPNVAFEETLERFVRDSFSSEAFGDIVGRFVDTIVSYGASNSLAQLALRLAGPGVPDVYQGCERWDLSLVDPDNRRRVDYGASRQMLAALRSGGQDPLLRAKDLVRTFTDGRIKMFVTTTGLTLRRSETPLFLEGSYEPLESSDHVVAFERRLGDRRLVCVAPRLARTLTGGQHRWAMGSVWGETMLKVSRAGSFEDAFTGRRFDGQELRLSEVLSDFPVAWLLAGR